MCPALRARCHRHSPPTPRGDRGSGSAPAPARLRLRLWRRQGVRVHVTRVRAQGSVPRDGPACDTSPSSPAAAALLSESRIGVSPPPVPDGSGNAVLPGLLQGDPAEAGGTFRRGTHWASSGDGASSRGARLSLNPTETPSHGHDLSLPRPQPVPYPELLSTARSFWGQVPFPKPSRGPRRSSHRTRAHCCGPGNPERLRSPSGVGSRGVGAEPGPGTGVCRLFSTNVE